MAAGTPPTTRLWIVPLTLALGMGLLIFVAIVEGAHGNASAIAAPSQYSSSPPNQPLASPVVLGGIGLGIVLIVLLILLLFFFRKRGGKADSEENAPEGTDASTSPSFEPPSTSESPTPSGPDAPRQDGGSPTEGSSEGADLEA